MEARRTQMVAATEAQEWKRMFARALVNEAECSDLNSCVAEPSALPMNSSQRHTRVRLADDTLYPVANETRRDLLGGWVECTRLADWRRCSPGARSLCAADNRTKEGGRKSGVGCEESAMLLGSVPAVLPLAPRVIGRCPAVAGVRSAWGWRAMGGLSGWWFGASGLAGKPGRRSRSCHQPINLRPTGASPTKTPHRWASRQRRFWQPTLD